MGFLIDSSVIIALERGRLAMESLNTRAAQDPLAISAITASELLHGVHRAGDPDIRRKRAAFVDYVFDLLPIVPFDLDVARVHARLWAELAAQGAIIGAHDLLIAATAVALDYGVITLNEREFGRIPGLVVFTP